MPGSGMESSSGSVQAGADLESKVMRCKQLRARLQAEETDLATWKLCAEQAEGAEAQAAVEFAKESELKVSG